jgi:hypothetical protein
MATEFESLRLGIFSLFMSRHRLYLTPFRSSMAQVAHLRRKGDVVKILKDDQSCNKTTCAHWKWSLLLVLRVFFLLIICFRPEERCESIFLIFFQNVLWGEDLIFGITGVGVVHITLFLCFIGTCILFIVIVSFSLFLAVIFFYCHYYLI